MFMPRLSLTPSRLASLIAWLLALALCAWLLSDLVLRFITPPPPPAALHASTVDPRAAARHLDARAPLAGTASAADTAPEAAAAPTGFTLHGVATGFGRAPGFALIAPTGGAVTAYVTGDSLAPGVTLVGLAPHHVVIERNGARKTLPLSRDQPAVAALPLPPSAPVQPPPQSRQAPPPAAIPGPSLAPKPPRTTGVLSARPPAPRDH